MALRFFLVGLSEGKSLQGKTKYTFLYPWRFEADSHCRNQPHPSRQLLDGAKRRFSGRLDKYIEADGLYKPDV